MDTFISQFCKHGKKTNHQMLFVLVSNHPDFYLDGPILTSDKKKCTSKSINIVYQKMSYSILVKSMGQYDPHNHCVYLDSDLIYYNL